MCLTPRGIVLGAFGAALHEVLWPRVRARRHLQPGMKSEHQCQTWKIWNGDLRMSLQACDDKAMNSARCFGWRARFKSGRASLEDEEKLCDLPLPLLVFQYSSAILEAWAPLETPCTVHCFPALGLPTHFDVYVPDLPSWMQN